MNINGLNLNLLRVFAAIHENGTLTRAAEQLGLSQPAVSHSLKKLREIFEDELFVREIDGYRATAKAKELADPIVEALDSLRGVIEATGQFDPRTASKTFRACMSDYGSHTILPELSKFMRSRAPNIRLVVSQISYERVSDQLRKGQIDLAMMARDSADLEEGEELVLQESVVCIVRKGHPRVRGKLDLASFTGTGHVIVNMYGQMRTQVDDALAKLGEKRDVKLVVPYFNAVPEIVSITDLIGSLPFRQAKQAAANYSLNLHPLPFEFPPVHFITRWHPRRKRDLELRWLRGAISEVCASL